MNDILIKFIEKIQLGKIDLYNEFGVQFELAIFLRALPELIEYKIELERPIGHFGIKKTQNIPKKEIDIVIYNENRRYGIEIKFSNNGQVPIQMFKFCEDICFLEHLKKNGFDDCFSLVIVDRNDFYKKKRNENGIYKFFRNEKEMITGKIICPTGKDKGKEIEISGQYKPIWSQLIGKYFGYLIKISSAKNHFKL